MSPTLITTATPPGDLVDVARHASHVEVFTGAGMSADSGLDTFRDATTGLWSKVDPQAMASIDAWEEDPEPMLAWYLWRARLCREAKPNDGHDAVSTWADKPETSVHVATQNIDDLHERAGSRDVAHLHGSLFDFRCSACGAKASMPEIPEEQTPRVTPPACQRCGASVRPGVVWFGEMLPEDHWRAAEDSMRIADLVVIVGTSGVVYPAAGLPVVGKRSGATVLEISPVESDLTPLCDFSWRTTAAEGLPALVAAL